MPGMGGKSREEDREICPCGACILEGEGRPPLTKTTVDRAAEFRGGDSGEAGTQRGLGRSSLTRGQKDSGVCPERDASFRGSSAET